MNFYMCQTAQGPRLAGTQADARALDKGFKEHVVPDDKAGRMAYVNALLTQAYQGAELTAVTIPPMDELLAGLDDDAKADLLKRLGGAADIARGAKLLPADYRGHPEDCPHCFRSKRGALQFAQAADKDDLEDQIDHITEGWQLDRLAEAIESRRREINKPAPAPAPRIRVRKPA